MSQTQERLLRTAGLSDSETPQLRDVNRRRAQLWLLSVMAGFVLPMTIFAIALGVIPHSLSAAFDGWAVWVAFLAVLITVFWYVGEREAALRKLTDQLFEERERTLQHLRARQSMEATVEALCELDRMKDDFLAMITYELRSPLTSILGILGTLERSAHELDKDQLQELTRAARRQSWRLDGLVSDLLEGANLQEGTTTLNPCSLDIAAAMRDVVAPLARNAVDHTITLQLPEDGAVRRIDQGAFARIVLNLVGNALKHTPPGTAVEVIAKAVDDGVEIVVSDDGPGIPPDRRKTAFDKFWRGGAPNQAGGLGLGLHTVRSLAEAHGGSATLDPDAPGARLRVELAELGGRPPDDAAGLAVQGAGG